MTIEEKIALLEDRYRRLAASEKNIKAPGVKRKVSRQIFKLKEKIS